MLTRARKPRTVMESVQDLPDGAALVEQPAVDEAHELGLRLVDHEVAADPLLRGDVAIAGGGTAEGGVTVACLLPFAAAEPLAQDSALLFGDGALDLQQQLVVGILADRPLNKNGLAARTTQLVEDEHLIGVFARQPVRGQDGDHVAFARAGGVAQPVEPRSIQIRAAVALVAKEVLRLDPVALLLAPAGQLGELALNRLVTLLVQSRDARIDGGRHAHPLLRSGVGALRHEVALDRSQHSGGRSRRGLACLSRQVAARRAARRRPGRGARARRGP